MIFISVLLPAPFSPTRPWISPGRSSKSTPRSASTPPKVLPIPFSSRRGEALSGMTGSDQEVIFHPLHARRIGLGHDRAIGADALRNALARLPAGSGGGAPGNDRATRDAAGGCGDGCEHPPLAHGLDRRRHGVAPADQDVGPVMRLHDVVGGERHVVIVEE